MMYKMQHCTYLKNKRIIYSGSTLPPVALPLMYPLASCRYLVSALNADISFIHQDLQYI